MTAADRFRAAIEAGDVEAVAATLADDAVFHSPVKFTPFEGRTAVTQVVALVMQVFENFRYVGALEGSGSRADEGDAVPTEVLVFRADVDGTSLHGIDLIQVDDAGQIAELTVMVRPQSALHALRDAMNRKLVEAGLAPASVLEG